MEAARRYVKALRPLLNTDHLPPDVRAAVDDDTEVLPLPFALGNDGTWTSRAGHLSADPHVLFNMALPASMRSNAAQVAGFSDAYRGLGRRNGLRGRTAELFDSWMSKQRDALILDSLLRPPQTAFTFWLNSPRAQPRLVVLIPIVVLVIGDQLGVSRIGGLLSWACKLCRVPDKQQCVPFKPPPLLASDDGASGDDDDYPLRDSVDDRKFAVRQWDAWYHGRISLHAAEAGARARGIHLAPSVLMSHKYGFPLQLQEGGTWALSPIEPMHTVTLSLCGAIIRSTQEVGGSLEGKKRGNQHHQRLTEMTKTCAFTGSGRLDGWPLGIPTITCWTSRAILSAFPVLLITALSSDWMDGNIDADGRRKRILVFAYTMEVVRICKSHVVPVSEADPGGYIDGICFSLMQLLPKSRMQRRKRRRKEAYGDGSGAASTTDGAPGAAGAVGEETQVQLRRVLQHYLGHLSVSIRRHGCLPYCDAEPLERYMATIKSTVEIVKRDKLGHIDHLFRKMVECDRLDEVDELVSSRRERDERLRRRWKRTAYERECAGRIVSTGKIALQSRNVAKAALPRDSPDFKKVVQAWARATGVRWREKSRLTVIPVKYVDIVIPGGFINAKVIGDERFASGPIRGEDGQPLMPKCAGSFIGRRSDDAPEEVWMAIITAAFRVLPDGAAPKDPDKPEEAQNILFMVLWLGDELGDLPDWTRLSGRLPRRPDGSGLLEFRQLESAVPQAVLADTLLMKRRLFPLSSANPTGRPCDDIYLVADYHTHAALSQAALTLGHGAPVRTVGSRDYAPLPAARAGQGQARWDPPMGTAGSVEDGILSSDSDDDGVTGREADSELRPPYAASARLPDAEGIAAVQSGTRPHTRGATRAMRHAQADSSTLP